MTMNRVKQIFVSAWNVALQATKATGCQLFLTTRAGVVHFRVKSPRRGRIHGNGFLYLSDINKATDIAAEIYRQLVGFIDPSHPDGRAEVEHYGPAAQRG